MVAVVGDIHGCYYTFLALLNKIGERYPGVELYSVGDLVDRGKFSCSVIDCFIENGFKFCIGNHEQMFLHFVEKTDPYLALNWIQNGYETTLLSYEQQPEKIDEHINFIKSSPLYFNLDDCFISHAGISSAYKNIIGRRFEIGSEEFNKLILRDIAEETSILWTRDTLLDLGKLQVVGHSRKPEVVIKKKNNAVYIDTSAFTGNGLSAVIVENSNILEIIFEKTDNRDF